MVVRQEAGSAAQTTGCDSLLVVHWLLIGAETLNGSEHVVVLEEDQAVDKLVDVRQAERGVVVLQRQLAGAEGRHRLGHERLLPAVCVAQAFDETRRAAAARATRQAVHHVQVEQEVAALGLAAHRLHALLEQMAIIIASASAGAACVVAVGPVVAATGARAQHVVGAQHVAVIAHQLADHLGLGVHLHETTPVVVVVEEIRRLRVAAAAGDAGSIRLPKVEHTARQLVAALTHRYENGAHLVCCCSFRVAIVAVFLYLHLS